MPKRFYAPTKKKYGPTLPESLVIILIISIFALIVIPTFINARNEGFDIKATDALVKTESELVSCYDGKEKSLDFRKCSKPSNVTVVELQQDGFTLQKSSKSGHVFTIVRYPTGKTVRICAGDDVRIGCPKGWPE